MNFSLLTKNPYSAILKLLKSKDDCMKITCLTENTSVNDDIKAEHGLSLFIETNEHRILFDTGQTELFSKNADKLGVALDAVDIAVLSHGHYDHGGGLVRFLQLNEKAPVYMNKNAFGDYYNGTEKYIGLDKRLKESDRIILTDDQYKIADGLTLFTCNDREKSFDLGSFGLNKNIDGEFIPDDFLHEHYLLIEEEGKRILISGCSHKGVLNIAQWFKPDFLIGGFHFSKLPLDDTLKGYALFLDSLDTEFFTCHCTGEEQYRFMKKYMKKLSYISAGQTVNL